MKSVQSCMFLFLLTVSCSREPSNVITYGNIDDVVVEVTGIEFFDGTATRVSFSVTNNGVYPHLVLTRTGKNPSFRMEVLDDETKFWRDITPSVCGVGREISTVAPGEVLSGRLKFDQPRSGRFYRIGVYVQTPSIQSIRWGEPFNQTTQSRTNQRSQADTLQSRVSAG